MQNRKYTAIYKSVAIIGLLFSNLSYAADHCRNMPVSGKIYTIVNEGSGLVLDVAGKDKKNGADVVQWSSNKGTNQQWKLTDLGNGAWSIRPVHSDKSLDVYGWTSEEKKPIKQWEYYGNDNQQWKLNATANGGIKIVSSYSKLPVGFENTNKSSKLLQLSDSSSANQRWYFDPIDGKCENSANSVLGKSFMGGTKVLIGTANNAAADKAPFDIQYQYLNQVAPLDSCYSSCKADSKCGNWWGCWQWDELAPGSQYPLSFITDKSKLTYDNQSHPQMTYWTYYSLLSLTNGEEGQAEIDAVNDSAKLKRYFNDYRFLLKKLGDNRSILHLEPDFWGFVRGTKKDPQTIPAKVNEANPDDCPAQTHANTVAGFARCLITMSRKYAPNVAVGLHASPWNYTADGDAEVVAKFMNSLGAGEGDFIVTDPSDRDAGWYSTVKGDDSKWWDDKKFATYLSWSKSMSEIVGKPTIMWQIPLGNSWQDNTYQHYKDNKVELLFKNINDVAAAHVIGLLFGSGDTPQTYLDNDGGMLINKTTDYWKSGGATIK